MPRGRVGPKQISEVVPRELLACVEGKTNQQREVFARAEPHLLTGNGEQCRAAQTVQNEMMSHLAHAFS